MIINIKNHCRKDFINQKNSYGFGSWVFFYTLPGKDEETISSSERKIFLLAGLQKEQDTCLRRSRSIWLRRKKLEITFLHCLNGRKTSVPSATSMFRQHNDCGNRLHHLARRPRIRRAHNSPHLRRREQIARTIPPSPFNCFSSYKTYFFFSHY